MSAYEIGLDFTEGTYGPPEAFITAHDPVADHTVSISFQCFSYDEIRVQVERLKNALDKVDAEARKRFAVHAEKTAKKK